MHLCRYVANANSNLTFCCTNLQARANVPPFLGCRSCSAEEQDIPGHLSFLKPVFNQGPVLEPDVGDGGVCDTISLVGNCVLRV